MSYRHFKVDSAKRDTGTASDFRIKLPRTIQKGDVFELVFCHIPQTVFNIDTTNNTFVCSEGTATLTPGYYTNETVATELETQLNALGGPLTFTVALQSNTQTLTISASGAFSVSMDGVNSPLGFTSNTGSATAHSGSKPVNLERHQSVLIDVNDVVEIEGTNYGTTFCIPSDVDILQVIDWRPGSGFQQYVHFTADTKVLHVRLKSIENAVLDLHGAEWFMLLRHVP